MKCLMVHDCLRTKYKCPALHGIVITVSDLDDLVRYAWHLKPEDFDEELMFATLEIIERGPLAFYQELEDLGREIDSGGSSEIEG